jgi:hypothetical protein
MKPILVASVVVVVCAAACVRQERFRFVPATSACFPETVSAPQTPGPPDQKPSLDCRHSQYSVAFIEFDSQGKALDPNEEAVALKLLDRAKAGAPSGKIITVVYVHGWKNNAAEAEPGARPKDVEKFENALLELGYRAGEAAKAGTKPVPVVGVYIGWRGKTLMGPDWYTALSLWSRRNTANRVGSGADLAPILNRIIEKTNEGSGTSRVLMIGHSFGARVLEHAVETKRIELYDRLPESGFVNPRVDLVLYVNSANDARLSMARVQELRAHPVSVHHPDYDPAACGAASAGMRDEVGAATCRDYPLLVAITSKGDSATKYLLPIANTINGDKHSAPMPNVPAGNGFADPVPSGATFRRAAAAHLPFLQSHTVREITCPPLFAPAVANDQDARRRDEENKARRERALHPVCPAADASCRFAFRTRGEEPACFEVDQRAAVAGKPPFNDTAFWIMNVEPAVIKDHGDIWNVSFVEMLGQLMAPRGFFEPGARRVQLRAAAASDAK